MTKYLHKLGIRVFNNCTSLHNTRNLKWDTIMFENKGQERIEWPAKVPAFGKEMRKEFLLDDQVTFLNHCGKGAVPRVVHKQQIRLLEQYESNPEYFLKVTRDKGWNQNIRIIADFVGAGYKNLAFVENTTRGICNILTSYPYVDGDVILYNTRTHPAMKNQIDEILRRYKHLNLEAEELQLQLPCSSSDIVHKYREILDFKPKIKLAVIDYVCGSPATLFPVEELIELCHQHSTDVLVDGAHAPGLIPLRLEELKADFFVGNLHKWLFTPRGCAIQYVSPKYQSHIRPCVPSFNAKEPYPQAFVDQGTRNEIPYLCVEAAVQFHHWIGGHDAISSYNIPLLETATKLLVTAWGTSEAEYPSDEKVPFIRNIRLPRMWTYQLNKAGSKRLRYDLYYRFNIWAGIFLHNNQLWVRISAQIYCSLPDYEKLRDAVLILMDEAKSHPLQMESKQNFSNAVFSGP